MGKAAGGASFPLEPLAELVAVEALSQELDRDSPIEHGIATEVDVAHPPARQKSLDPVFADDLRC
jgi:hypothetical protein